MAALGDQIVLPAETGPDELRVLSDLLAGCGDVSVVSATGERYVLGAELREVLAVAARALGEGQAVSVVEPRRTMLSTQQAADILGVSRPTLIKLMESGEITFTKPGRHRRVALADVLRYKQRITQARRWLLQCNPDRYDTDHQDWLAYWGMARKDLAAKLHPGDQVVIWKSGKDAGVYATAKVAEGEPYKTETKPDTGWKHAEDIGKPVWRVDLEDGRRLDRPVLRSTLQADPRFEDALILKIPKAANPFPVSDEEWDAIFYP